MIRRLVADARRGVRDPYWWLIQALTGGALLVGARGDAPAAVALLILAGATLAVGCATA